MTDGGVGIALGVCQPTADRPARCLRTGCSLEAATGDIGGFLGGVADLGRREAEAEKLHTHDAQGEQERHHHGEFGAHLPPGCPTHEFSIRRADYQAPYMSSRSTPEVVTRRRRSGRGEARSAMAKLAATRFATFSASAGVRAWITASGSPLTTGSPIFFWSTMPTARSIGASLRSRPAPSALPASAISRALARAR